MKLAHITIQTNKFCEEIEFYKKYVGLKIVNELRDNMYNIVFLAENDIEPQIEIIENSDADSSGKENISIGFYTDKFECLYDELKNNGFSVTPIISPVPQVEFFFVKDPAGVKVQFIKNNYKKV